MKRRVFCGITLIAGAATSLPIGRLISAPSKSSQPEPADLRAVKLSGAETTIERAAVQDFRASLRGPLFSVGQERNDRQAPRIDRTLRRGRGRRARCHFRA